MMKKTVIVTSGPRGSGKTTYVEKIKLLHPEVGVVSRDKFFLEKYGTESIDPNESFFKQAFIELENLLEKELTKSDIVIFDCWNGDSDDRRWMNQMIRSKGADIIKCWVFIIPFSTCLNWFQKKPNVQKMSPKDFFMEYVFYYQEGESVPKDGFDTLHFVNPEKEPTLWL